MWSAQGLVNKQAAAVAGSVSGVHAACVWADAGPSAVRAGAMVQVEAESGQAAGVQQVKSEGPAAIEPVPSAGEKPGWAAADGPAGTA